MYTLYHIKGKKWGLTEQKLERRLWQQKMSLNDVSNIITCGNIDMAADMERDLNIEYGYGWNESRDYRNIIKNRKCNFTNSDRMKGAYKGGKSAILSGQLLSVCSIGGKNGGKIAGKIQSQKEYICPNCNRKGRGNRFVSHIKHCI
jgi:3-oxoacyl-ACP reductase-like protein